MSLPQAGPVQIRVVGRPEHVAAALAALAATPGVVVLKQSRQAPRRDEPGRVAVHARVRVVSQ